MDLTPAAAAGRVVEQVSGGRAGRPTVDDRSLSSAGWGPLGSAMRRSLLNWIIIIKDRLRGYPTSCSLGDRIFLSVLRTAGRASRGSLLTYDGCFY